jgi:peptide/nickel transport system substrate-binding protein
VLAALEGVEGVTVETTAGGTWEHLDLQFSGGRHDSFEHPLVREAFLSIIPRQQIVDELVTPVQKDAEVLDSLVFLAGEPGYDESVATNGSRDRGTVDVTGARALLAEAGIPRPRVCIMFDPSNPRRVAEFGLIRSSAKQAGFIITNCSKPKWADFLGVPGAYDAALFGWNTTNLAVSAAEARLGSASDVSNFNHYASDEVDALLEELSMTQDAAAQRSILADVDAALWRDSYGLPLYQFPVMTAHSARVTGVENSTLEPGVVWNIWDWKPTADSESSGSSR